MRRALAILLVCAGVAAGCGSRLPDEVLSDIDAERAGASRNADDDDERVLGDGAAAGEGAGGDASDDGAGGFVDGSVGSTDGAAGGGDTGSAGGTPDGSTPGYDPSCRGGATAPGVTADTIRVATMVTDSGPLPGATAGGFRGAQAYAAKVNAEGGICGRRLVVVKGDDGLDPQRGRGEFLRLEPQVFAFVGSLAVADAGYADLVASTRVPYVGTMVDAPSRSATVYPRVAENVTHTGPFQYYRDAYPEVDNMAFLWADVGGVRANTPTSREALKAVGFNLVHDSGLGTITPDFTSDVITMRDKGAQGVYLFAFEVNMHVRIARNMRQQNFDPPLKISQIGYNSKLIELLGGIADGWTNHIDYLPMLNEDEPAKSPALAEFLLWHERVAPGGQIDLFPVNAYAYTALFVEAAKRAGPDLTREGLLTALDSIERIGGIRAPSNPVTGATEGCFVIVRVEGGQWVREHPSSGFECGLGRVHRYG